MCDLFMLLSSDGRARSGRLRLPVGDVVTPIFMPVGTKAAVKGIDYDTLKTSGCMLSLANTYHLGCRPGKMTLEIAKGICKFTSSDGAFLTDSGGFQMVSLSSLATVTEEGVSFIDPYDSSLKVLITPEESISIQNAIGADIVMALDDVVSSTVRDKERLTLATHRTTRWLDRCISAHKNAERQHLFGIVQGSIYPDLRRISIDDLKNRNLPGYAIGGLSGGEDKDDFWRIVEMCTRTDTGLPVEKPRYLMGVGYVIDVIVSVALGCDMFDSVFPTRTARFGTALTDAGSIRLQHAKYKLDFRPLDPECDCECCSGYSRSFLHYGFKKSVLVTQLLTVHNIRYMMRLCSRMQRAIMEKKFGEFIKEMLQKIYLDNGEIPPQWVCDALLAAGVDICNMFAINETSIQPY